MIDSTGISAAIKLLKKRVKENHSSIYIVTHRDDVMHLFDGIINIHMENDFSRISEA